MSDVSGKRAPDGLTADVSDDVIQAALESVEREARGGRGEQAGVAAHAATGEDRAAPEAESADRASVDDLEKELREVRAALDLSVERARETLDRLKDTHERYLRASADLDNYKKRALREKDEAERYGVQKLLKDLLPVMDNLDRALGHASKENPLHDGVSATRRLFEDTLGRHGVKSFTTLGQPFDPSRHEAMQQIETHEHPPGAVAAELVRGYLLHDRLVRPALVAVAKAPPPPAPEPSPSEPPPPSVASETPKTGETT